MGPLTCSGGKPKSVLDALQSSPEFQKQKELFDVMSALCESGVDAMKCRTAQVNSDWHPPTRFRARQYLAAQRISAA